MSSPKIITKNDAFNMMYVLEPPPANTLAALCWDKILKECWNDNLTGMMKLRHSYMTRQVRDKITFANFKIASMIGEKMMLVEAQIRMLALTRQSACLQSAILIISCFTENDIDKIRHHIPYCEPPITLIIEYAILLSTAEKDPEMLLSVINVAAALNYDVTSATMAFDTIGSICAQPDNKSLIQRLTDLRLNVYCINCGRIH